MNRSMNDQIVTRLHYVGAPTATVTPSNGIDVSDLTEVEVVAVVGEITNIGNSPVPSWTLALQEGDAVDGSHSAVADADVARNSGNNAELAAGVFATIGDAAADSKVYRLGYLGGKKSIKVVATAADTPGATPLVLLVIGKPKIKPGTDS
jgi:hypothetical protein